MRNSILAILSLAICSLPVDAEAVTFKQNTCPRTNGFCVVNCDPGMVVVGGGCLLQSRLSRHFGKLSCALESMGL